MASHIFIKPIATYVPPQALLSVYVETGDAKQFELLSDIDAGITDVTVSERTERHTRVNLVLDGKYVPQYYEDYKDDGGSVEDEDEETSPSLQKVKKTNALQKVKKTNVITIQLPLTVEQLDTKTYPMHMHPIFEAYLRLSESDSSSKNERTNAQKVINKYTTIARNMKRYHEILSMISNAAGGALTDDLVPPSLQARVSSVVNGSSQNLREQSTKVRAEIDATLAWFKRNLFKNDVDIVYKQAEITSNSEAEALTTTIFNDVIIDFGTQVDD